MKAQARILSGALLHKLPAEVLGIIATKMDNPGLASMRATCRELRDGSAFEFFQRYSSLDLRLYASERHNYLSLFVVSESPNVVMAQALTQDLILQ